MKKLITAMLLCLAAAANGQSPTVYSWVFNTTGLTGYNCSGCSPAHTGTITSNIQSVYYTSTNAYITCAGVPSYNVGPWASDPNVPTDQSFVFKIPLSPTSTGTFTATELGQIGIWSNGVCVYNPEDGYYWDTATNAFGNTVGVTALWNRNAYLYEGSSFDACLGHADSHGCYHNHINPKCVYDETDSTSHSPIIGFAFDGYPIYGAYGYANTDGTGGIKRMASSYVLTTATTRLYGPPMSSYAAGTFVEDYVYTAGAGDLDAHNGRFCVTPEYPSGTYAYFVTINSSFTPQYPFVIGPTFYGTPQMSDMGTGGHNTIPGTATLYNPYTILGTKTVCTGSVTTLSSAVSGGTWSSTNTSVATVGTGNGNVTGVASGTTTITYNVSGTITSAVVTVNATPSAISGSTSVCVGSTTTVTDATTGGTWSGGSTSVATIGSSTGTITGVGSGTTTITYSLSSGCNVTATVSASSSASAITGTTSVCIGSTTTLSDAGGGTWSSAATSIATVGSATGTVTGVAAGTTTITYSLSAGCRATTVVTVNASLSSISGSSTVCTGATTTLTNPSGGGTWSSGSTSVATVNSTGTVTGVSAGTAVISYTLSCGVATKTITVSTAASAGVISGTSSAVCTGATIALTDGVSGGAWTSGSTSVATVNSTGTVTGVSAGTATISYTVSSSCGSAAATMAVTVNASPSSISGSSTVCTGATTTLTNTSGGGTWSSANTSVATVNSTGTVTGVSAGTTVISYTLSCGTATKTITVSAAAGAGTITGTVSNVCSGSVISLTDATSGGAWSSGNTSVATVNTSGAVTGVSAGTVNISYTVSGSCGTAAATMNVTVIATPAAGTISGASSVTVGSAVTLSDATSGGSWSMSNTNATITGGGVVTGVSAGLDTTIYSVTNTCGTATATKTITINASVPPITGITTVCAGAATTLSDSTSGGTWSSSSTAVATITSSTGVVTGVAAGTTTISYVVSGGYATTTVTVLAAPQSITGTTSMCAGSSVALIDATTGGTWSSDNTAVATVNSSGFVTGVSGGTADITYMLSSGCYKSVSVSIGTVSAIIGTPAVCLGSSTTLSDASAGGTWSSSNTSAAVIGSTTGIVTGMAAPATSVITYTPASGCKATVVLTVNTTPSSISGSSSVCAGSTATLSDATGSGTWSSSNTAVASISSSTGVLTGAGGGSATITYALATGCLTTKAVTVNPAPAGISGTMSLCAGSTTTLSDATGGGTWASSSTSIASIGSTTGVMVAVSNGTATITYTIACGSSTATVTVGGAPAITSVSPNIDTVGDVLTISGSNFNTTITNNIVFFGATKATVTGATSTALTVAVPAGCTYMPVTVENTGCSVTAYARFPFLPTYDNSAYIPTTINFSSKVDFTSGINPFSVAIGDIDGDGMPDLVSANYGANTISVFHNTSSVGTISTSSFAAKVDFATGAAPYGLAIGDLDNDGKLDVVVTNKSSSPPTVSVFHNTASGGTINSSSLAAAVTFTVASGPIAVAIADLDKDGRADLAVANNGANTISVLRNTSAAGTINSSSFATHVDFAAGSHPFGIAVGDLDGDGRPDIAVPNQAAATVSVFRNTSSVGSITTGSFAGKVDFPTGSQPFGVTIGDVDGDGKLDLIVPNNAAATVSVLRNTATAGAINTGSFAGHVDFTTGAGPYAVAAGDINGDGKADLAIANRTSNTISILRNTSTSGSVSSSSFAAKVDFTTGSAPVCVAIGDLDGDGIPDVACANIASNTLSVLRNNPILHPAPHSGNTGSSVTLCTGSAIFLVAPAQNGSWNSDDVTIAAVDEQTGMVTGITAGRTLVNYTTATATYSTPVVVASLPQAVTITAYPGTNVSDGQYISFAAAIQGSSVQPVYQWTINGKQVPGATNATYTANKFTDGDVITCTAGSIGCQNYISSTGLSINVQNGNSQVLATGSSIAIHPNPNNGSFYISGRLATTTDEIVSLEVTDLLGQTVYKANTVAKNGRIGEQVQLISTLANGMYLLNIRTGADNQVFRFIIEK